MLINQFKPISDQDMPVQKNWKILKEHQTEDMAFGTVWKIQQAETDSEKHASIIKYSSLQ